MAKPNPFRFSTKYQDEETGLLYYGHRYYNASTGRWLTRDRLAEAGGLNFYAFCGGDPLATVDRLGDSPATSNFRWIPPKFNPNGKAYLTNGAWVTGVTKWEDFAPDVKPYQRPGEPCCYGLWFVGGKAQANSWSRKGDKDAWMHEYGHLVLHLYPTYQGFIAEAQTYFKPCMSLEAIS